MSNDKDQELFEKIRLVLRNDWNPIGLSEYLPQDEYNSYIPKIIDLLKRKHKKRVRLAVFTYLMYVEFINIELIPKTLYWKLMRLMVIFRVVNKVIKFKND